MKKIKGFVLVILATAGLATFLTLYPEAFPIASLDLRVNKEEALRIAENYLHSLGFDISGYEKSVIFDGDEEALVFLERTLGLKQANELARREVPIWRWQLRWFKPLEKEGFEVLVNPTGKIDSFQHLIKETEAGENLIEQEAYNLGLEALIKQESMPIENYELVKSVTDKKSGRTDYHFEWRKKGRGIDWQKETGELRVKVEVHGRRVDSYQCYFKVPENFTRRLAELESKGVLFSLISLTFGIFLILAALVVFMFRFKKDGIRWRFPVVVGGVVMILLILDELNSIPIYRAAYATTTHYSTFISTLLVSGIITSLIVAIKVVLTGGAGDALTRELYPQSLGSCEEIFFKRTIGQNFRISSLRGYLWALVILGYITLFYYLGIKYFKIWVFPAPDYSNILGTYFPFLAPLSIGLLATISEEFVFRFFAVAFFKKYLKVTILAFLLPTLIWAFAHSSYDVFPNYVRGIELTVVGLLFCYLFVRYDLMVTLVAHYVIDAVLISIPLLRSRNRYFFISGIVVIGLVLIPALFSLLKIKAKKTALTKG